MASSKKGFLDYTASTAFPTAMANSKPQGKEVKSKRVSFATTPNNYNALRAIAANISNKTGKSCTPNSLFNEWLTGFIQEHEGDLNFTEIKHDSEGNVISD